MGNGTTDLGEGGARQTSRELDRASFDAMLAALDPDRDRAGQEYERLRNRLILFFRLHRAAGADDLADEAFNRLARKISQGEAIRGIASYLIGIARMLCHEERRRLGAEGALATGLSLLSGGAGGSADLLVAIEGCLKRLPGGEAGLIERYYSAESRARIETRKKMAEEMGISLNALRNRALRVRQEVEDCVRKQLELPNRPDIRPWNASNHVREEK